MKDLSKAKWIKPKKDFGDICPIYKLEFEREKEIKSAVLKITAMGVYEAHLNGIRVGNFIMAPGWTDYRKRHQYQEYDISGMIENTNVLTITVASGWYRLRKLWWADRREVVCDEPGLICSLTITYADGEEKMYVTDSSWKVSKSKLLYCDLYNGVVYDSRKNYEYDYAEEFDFTKENLIKQEGGDVVEHETILPVEYIITPKGERVIDFGQNLTGYIEFSGTAKSGDEIVISHAEVLDKDGNFYTENYRTAEAKIKYICSEGKNKYKPTLTFYGFRYIRIDKAPDSFRAENFKAIVVYSDIKQTGYLSCGHQKLNKFFTNVIWGQKGNFLDIPTDCPQRDERFGWTGDVTAFVKTATYQYDVERFFEKWMNDLVSEQRDDGSIPNTVPNIFINAPQSNMNKGCAMWGDVATVCPWQIYLAYGDIKVLESHYESMCRWLDFIDTLTDEEHIWVNGYHYGDWLGLDAEEGSLRGKSDQTLVSTAYYANSVSIVIKTGKLLNKDVSAYEKLYDEIVSNFRKRFSTYNTQTECVLALRFNLAEDMKSTAKKLVDLINDYGHLTTGFAGTHHILHALSENGYAEIAYELLLREEFPSWLFAVNRGATTVWEHWDGIREDGTFWSKDMNSFNHYAYGSAVDWVYSVAAGIKETEEYPGFEKVVIQPTPDKRLGYLNAEFETKYGKIISKWTYNNEGKVTYDIITPVPATIIINGEAIYFDGPAHFSETI